MVNFAFGFVLFVAVCCILIAEFAPAKKAGPYHAPVVQSATWMPRDGRLLMEVTAENGKDISGSLNLPRGSVIRDGVGEEHLYLVECPIPLQGNEMSDREVFLKAIEWARAFGFDGQVRIGG